MLRWFEKRGDLSFFITIMIALGIFFLSSFSVQSGPKSFALLPMLYHMIVFFLLTLFLMITLVKGEHKNLIPIAFVMAVLYGVSDELHQYLVPGRSSSIGDVFLDTIGVVFACLIYLIALEFRK